MHMADSTNLDFLPEGLRSEIEKSASAQGRRVSEVVAEAVDRYLKDQQWSQVKTNIRQRARGNGWTEDDVDRAIAESRAEISR
jgi:hypothetical protein